ncbi:Hypothetical protein FKW44_003919 [Caligus rogercresseyi]|uniref:Uncharacterized protein n=1 Tax=Caligus rogercresseyi TaxID=217165 RepID=A0A7T8KMC2_CALRO|nr:Hypothetical protein FKW44_003919 [Caligus rogercresseyi]
MDPFRSPVNSYNRNFSSYRATQYFSPSFASDAPIERTDVFELFNFSPDLL